MYNLSLDHGLVCVSTSDEFFLYTNEYTLTRHASNDKKKEKKRNKKGKKKYTLVAEICPYTDL